MRLLIDAGNSYTKWAWQPAQPERTDDWQVHALANADWIAGLPHAAPLHAAIAQASACLISNVAGEAWLAALPDTYNPSTCCVIESPATWGNVSNGYHSPAQLGSDRWCSLLAVWQQYQASALIVSLGTAMTLDYLQKTAPGGACFVGGTIQPGLRLMWRSLQQGAAQLKQYDLDALTQQQAHRQIEPWPTTSQQAMWQGCVTALVASICQRYAELQSTDPEIRLILTGGDAALIHAALPDRLSAQAIIGDNLVLKGLAWMAHA